MNYYSRQSWQDFIIFHPTSLYSSDYDFAKFKSSRWKEFCSAGICLMLSMFKVSVKLVQLFLSCKFFCWHLDIFALY